MEAISTVNWITVFFACVFIAPVLVGMLRPFSSGHVQSSVMSLVDVLELLLSVILSLYFTRLILTDDGNIIQTTLYKIIPQLQGEIDSRSVFVYLIFIIVFLIIINGILHLITIPFYKYGVVPMSRKIAASVKTMKNIPRRIVGGLWQLPKSVLFVLLTTILLSLYTGFFSNSPLADYAAESVPYRLIENNAVGPLLNTGVVRNIQILLSDSFKTADSSSVQTEKLQLIRYFNGVTLDQAVQSNADIDATAKKAVGSETDTKQKAYLIYKWICRNISYDDAKAAAISQNPMGVSSGAIVAFNTRKGVCFDFSALYVAMCRAVGEKVRFVTGLGFSGTSWGDHAWNQAYAAIEDEWINVDATFGSAGMSYFNRPDFNLDHSDGVVQQEW